MYCILLVLFFCCTVLGQQQGNNSCTTGDQIPGQCVKEENCAFALALKRHRKSATFCDADDLVCCPFEIPREQRQPGDLSLKKCHECCPSDNYYAIYNGVPSLLDRYPHMAAIGFANQNTFQWLCGGTLISEKFVITAAHCLFSQELGPARYVRIGDLDLATDTDKANPQDFTVNRIIPHPDYNPPSKYHDIALIELDRPVKFTKSVAVLCLNTVKEHSKNMIATGWGRTEFLGSYSSHLLEAGIKQVPHAECQKNYRNSDVNLLPNGIVDEIMICGGGKSDTCQGDSGGPLVVRHPSKRSGFANYYNLVGITSFGKACGVPGAPIVGVYTRVSYYVPWIEQIVWPNE